jgi:hypothetical protein
MKRARIALLLGISTGLAAISASAWADDVVRWKTIIGIIQAGNVVGNIPGGGQPWSTTSGEAKVNLRTGHIEFNVRGLVLAGGNSIGTPDAITLVKGTLICNPGTTNTTVDTPPVPLTDTGDAQFSGDVVIPPDCIPVNTPPNIAFLVRIPAGRWIANGAVRQSND